MVRTKYPASVQSIERGLNLLEALSGETEGLGVTELARRTNLPVSTVHRLLSVFVKRGYINREGARCSYRVAAKLLGLGFLPANLFCEVYQLIRERLWERMVGGEVSEVFVKVGSRALFVRMDRHSNENGTLWVPDFKEAPTRTCPRINVEEDVRKCLMIRGGALYRQDKADGKWCTCVPLKLGRTAADGDKVGVVGGGLPPLRTITGISSDLNDMREELRRSNVPERKISKQA